MGPHLRLPLFPGVAGPFCHFSLSYSFHDIKGHGRIQPHLDKIQHNVVSGTDGRLYGALSLFYERLRVAQPYVGTMCQTGDTHQVGYILGLGVQKHADGEIRAEFGDAKSAQRCPSDIFRSDPQALCALKKFQDFRHTDGHGHGIHAGQILQHPYHGRIILSQDIQLQKVMIDAVIIKMCGDRTFHVVGRVLYGSKGVDLLSVRQNDDASGMLARSPFHIGTAQSKARLFRFPHAEHVVILIITFHVSECRLVLHSADGTCLESVSFAEQHARISVCLRLIIAREIQIDIRLLVPLEAKERFKRDTEAVFDQRFSADRAYRVRHVTA